MTDSELLHAVTELQNAKGNEKKTILEKYKNERLFRDFLYFALNPLLSYKISTESLDKIVPAESEGNSSGFENIKEVCMFLSSKSGVSHSDIRCVKSFLMQQGDELYELYVLLLCKKLRLGVTAATVNKIIPDLIPVWEVQQGYPWEKYPFQNGEKFFLTQKLNGVRATYYDGRIIARSGEEYRGLGHIIEDIKKLVGENTQVVLDGEITLQNKGILSDNEAFRVATGLINSDNADKIGLCYTIFDIVDKDEFDNVSCNIQRENYEQRRAKLDALSEKCSDGSVSILPLLYKGTDQSVIPKFLDQMVAEDKEGCMINLDVPYRRTRHRGILKVKQFYTMDLPIIRVEEGTGRLKGTLGAVVVDFKGNEVKVGSGFSDEQRAEFWKHQDCLVGTLCEVKYKEISYDKKTGKESLQFPIFVGMRQDKTVVSFG